MIHVAQPSMLLWGVLVVILLLLLWNRQDAGRRRRLQRFAAGRLIPALTENVSEQRRSLKKYLFLAAVFCCFVALARPQYGYHWVDVKQRGIDILFALDTSRSMRAADIRPSRLERSKLAILDFIATLEGDRVGLLPFAGTAYLMCPLTSDYQAFEQSLAAVDTGLLPVEGTDLTSAVETAERALRNEANHKILIIVSDGENFSDDAVRAAKRAHERGMTIHTVGVGTAAGELIPDPKNGGFLKDPSSDTFVTSRLDEELLKRVAENGGGLAVRLGSNGEGLTAIYREKLSLVPKTELAERRRQVPNERFGWPLAAAVFLLSVEYLVSGRKSNRPLPLPLGKPAWRKILPLALPPLLVALSQLPFTPSYGWADEHKAAGGTLAEAQGRYRRLIEEEPDNPALHYNHGTAAYRNDRFDEAVRSFNEALATDDLDLQEKAFYNRGNAQYRLGEQSLASDPAATRKAWEQARSSYGAALALNPDNDRAQANHRFVSDKLDQLESRQQQSTSPDNSPSSPSDARKKGGAKQEQANAPDNGSTAAQPDIPKESGPPKQDGNGTATDPGVPGRSDTGESGRDLRRGEKTDAGRHSAPAGPAAGRLDEPSSSDPQSRGMTREEAEQLLQTIEGETGRLDLAVPGPHRNTQPKGNPW